MYTEQDLQDAVDAGVLSEEASTSFKAFVEAKRQISLVDEEAFRLVTGFNDIFVVIASVLLLVSVGWIGGGLFGSVFVALIAWLLSEIFIKRKQMALPAILLFFAFSIAAGMAAALFLVFLQSVSTVSVIEVLGQQKTNIGIGVALLFALIHWLRFRVPVAVAGTVAVLIAFIKRKLNAKQQLAITCALEHFTAIIAHYLLTTPQFSQQLDPSVARLWMWHALEETEHKAVAFDVYQEVFADQKTRKLLMRIITCTFFTRISQLTLRLLLADPIGRKQWRQHLDGLAQLRTMIRTLAPAYLQYYQDNFHPDQQDSSEITAEWRHKLFGTQAA
jgi:hypothetical protein